MTQVTHFRAEQPAANRGIAAALSMAPLRLAGLVFIVLMCCLAFSQAQADPDLWGHVQYGRDTLQSGLAATATYTYSAVDHRWINHENLAELTLAYVIDQWGVPAILLGKVLLGLAVVLAVVDRARRQQVSWPVTIFTTLLLITIVRHFWPLRPQVFSYAIFTGMIWTLTVAFDGWQYQWHLPWWRRWARYDSDVAFAPNRWKMRLLWLVPLWLVLWTNTHGAFVAGLCVYLAYLGLRGCEVAFVRRGACWGMLRRLLLMAVVALLATFINPYSWRLHAWLVEALSVPWPEITEWHPLTWQHSAFGPAMLLLAFTLAGVLASRRPIDFTQTVVLILVGWQAWRHQRHLPFFAILVAFWLPIHWESFWRRIQEQVACTRSKDASQGTAASPWFRRGCLVALSLVNGVLLGLVVHRTRAIGVDRAEYPVTAVQFMREQGLTGRLVVTYNWAQYAIAALAPHGPGEQGCLVQFDGRFNTCYPQRVIDEHFDFVLGNGSVPRFRGKDSPPPRAEAVLESDGPELVLINRRQRPSVDTMQAQRLAWQLLYQDALAQVWGRQDVFDDPKSDRYLPPSRRFLSEQLQCGLVAWPAIASPGTTVHPFVGRPLPGGESILPRSNASL